MRGQRRHRQAALVLRRVPRVRGYRPRGPRDARADFSVLRVWLDRPVFRGLRVGYQGRTYKVGGPSWRGLLEEWEER